MDEKLMTTEELCEWLRISRATVWRWRKEGMPYIGRERSVRYNKESIKEWLEKFKPKN